MSELRRVRLCLSLYLCVGLLFVVSNQFLMTDNNQIQHTVRKSIYEVNFGAKNLVRFMHSNWTFIYLLDWDYLLKLADRSGYSFLHLRTKVGMILQPLMRKSIVFSKYCQAVLDNIRQGYSGITLTDT